MGDLFSAKKKSDEEIHVYAYGLEIEGKDKDSLVKEARREIRSLDRNPSHAEYVSTYRSKSGSQINDDSWYKNPPRRIRDNISGESVRRLNGVFYRIMTGEAPYEVRPRTARFVASERPWSGGELISVKQKLKS